MLFVLALWDTAVCGLTQPKPAPCSHKLIAEALCNELKFSPAIALGKHHSLSSVPVCTLCLLLQAALRKALLSDDYPLGTGICLARLED